VVRAHDPERADMLAAQAARIEADITAVVHPDELDALADLVRLETVKDTVRAGLADLDDYIRLLQLIHRQTNEWIRTDVVVEGDELAAFFENIAGLSGDGGAP
jgi:hypothetical protein